MKSSVNASNFSPSKSIIVVQNFKRRSLKYLYNRRKIRGKQKEKKEKKPIEVSVIAKIPDVVGLYFCRV